MQFATALIEYLISGIVASIWIMIIINFYVTLPLETFNNYKEIFILIYFPIAYVIGIYIDAISSLILKILKIPCDILFLNREYFKPIQEKLRKCIRKSELHSYRKSAKILSYSEVDIIRTMESYVSRDRIARGILLNSSITGIVCMIYLEPPLASTIEKVCLIFSIISFLVWVRLKRLSSKFKKVAIENLRARKRINSKI